MLPTRGHGSHTDILLLSKQIGMFGLFGSWKRYMHIPHEKGQCRDTRKQGWNLAIVARWLPAQPRGLESMVGTLPRIVPPYSYKTNAVISFLQWSG